MTIREQADAMLQDTRLFDILQSFGTAFLHGSYDLDLMVWHELDFGLQIDDLNNSSAFHVVAALSEVVYPTAVMVYNQLGREPRFVMRLKENVLIDFRFLHKDIEWKLDIMVVAKDGDLTGPSYNRDVKQELTPEMHRIIMSLKEQLVHSPLYRKSRWEFTNYSDYFGAHDMYMSVFGYGVATVKEFADYLRVHRGIDISNDVP